MPAARPLLRRLAPLAVAVLLPALGFASATAGCEVATTFDRSLIDGGDAAGGDATLAAPTGDGATEGAVGTDSGDAAGTDTGTDGGADAPSDGAVDAPADTNGEDVVVDGADFLDAAEGGACNTLTNGAPQVQQVDVAAPRPAATGGSLVDGTYFKSADVVYTGSGGATGLTGYVVRETLAITNSSTGTALLTSTFIDGSGTTTERITVSPTTSGGATTLTFVCPAFGPSATFFNTRTGDAGQIELDIYISTDRIETFTRQ